MIQSPTTTLPTVMIQLRAGRSWALSWEVLRMPNICPPRPMAMSRAPRARVIHAMGYLCTVLDARL